MDWTHWQALPHQPQPPPDWPVLVQALGWDARGDWDRAHALAQDVETREGASVHAYLHRREGDTANAAYWYRRAGRPVCHDSFDTERVTLVEALLASTDATNPRLPSAG